MDLLGRARNLFKGLSAPPATRVQYFSVVCPLGHRVRGQRTEGYQALRCPACGEGVFVLPASPLPEPTPPARSTSRRSPLDRASAVVEEGPVELRDPDEVTVDFQEPRAGADEVEIDWEDEAPGPASTPAPAPAAATAPPTSGARSSSSPAPPATKAEKKAPARKTSSSLGPQPRPRPAPAPAVANHRRVPAPAVDDRAFPDPGLRPIGRTDRRPWLILGAVGLLVMGTIAIRSWRHRHGELPQVAREGFAEGIPALEDGRFDRAYQLLAGAKEAVDSLGGEVENADEIRHAADEAGIFADLLSDSMESLLSEAARTSPQAWAARFDQVYKGRAVIIDSTIAATPESSPRHRYEIDYLVLPPGEGANQDRHARIDLTGFETITATEHRVGDLVTFGARLAAFQYDVASGEWTIRLEPRSGVLITHAKALEALGWPSGTMLPEPDSNREDQP